ncbi:MAG TPA: hypothetical protein VEZ20_11760 [Allosphingosinicella sp.]|jgi:hypothetical protein|nr:hypothetical protein [Allosphingosinicella sp.]
MIYVHRDLSKVPQEKLDALKALSDALEDIADPEARKAFINENKAAWSTVREELSAMSFNKCWYTEAREGVSRYQTDHYRPHGRAKQAVRENAPGYCWLAFDIENYRIVGVLANTQNQEYSDQTVGKGDWFPLLHPGVRASLEHRSIKDEIPLLLDPVDKDCPSKIAFNDNGEAHPSDNLPEADKAWVDDAIIHLGIRQDQLNRKRRAVWKSCSRKILQYDRFFKKPMATLSKEERETMKELAEELRAMSSCQSEFSATARSCLMSARLDVLIVQDEFAALNAAFHA